MYWHRRLALGAATMILAPALASAQTYVPADPPGDVPLTVDPSGAQPAPAEPEPEYSPPASAQPAPAGELPPGAEGEVVEEEGYYHYDDYEDYVDEREDLGQIATGPVPELHVVRKGDTLWDICGYYFNNPWEWPKVWSFNPTITNPHWIYPGDVVRLHGESAGAPAVADDGGGGDDPGREPTAIEARAPTALPESGVRLRQLGFVEDDDKERAFTIDGAEEERLMLSQTDVVYLAYPEGEPPQVGRRYAVYSEQHTIEHPDEEGKTVGTFVHVLGEVEVLSVKKGRRARAVIREATDVIERGDRVGELRRTFKDIETVPNEVNARGTIVAELDRTELIGAYQLVIVDLGAEQGIKTGNRMYVVRRGDAMPELLDRQVGEDDDRFPAYAIGQILIVQAGTNASVGIVTLSLQESEVGDHVLVRKSR